MAAGLSPSRQRMPYRVRSWNSVTSRSDCFFSFSRNRGSRVEPQEDQVESAVQPVVQQRIVVVTIDDLAETAFKLARRFADRVAPDGIGCHVERVDECHLEGVSPGAGVIADFKPAVVGAAQYAVGDQFLHRLPGGQVADADLRRELRNSGHRAEIVIAVFDPPFQLFGDLDVFELRGHQIISSFCIYS